MKINHRAHLWGTLQKKLVESKSKAVIQKQWENIIETPVLAVTSRDRQVLAGGYGTMCLPSGTLCFCHKMLCPGACLQEQAVEDPKKLQLHTQTRFAFQQPRLPTPAKSQDKALLKMWAFYCQNITKGIFLLFCTGRTSAQLLCLAGQDTAKPITTGPEENKTCLKNSWRKNERTGIIKMEKNRASKEQDEFQMQGASLLRWKIAKEHLIE